MVPEGWKKVRFDEVTQIANGQVDPKCEPYSEMAHIGPENVISHTGQITGCKTGKELGLISGKYEFDEYAIVYSKIRPNLNKVCKPGFRGLCSADMYPIWAKNGLNIDYLYHYMLSPAFYKLAVAMSMRTGMPKINRSDLNAVQIAIPPLPEQKKIAQILSTWDQAITATERLLENSQQRKKGLMQQLLTGKKRLPGFEGEFKAISLSAAATITMGTSPKSAAYNSIDDGLPLLQGNADIESRRSKPRVYTSEITKTCQPSDILLSVRAPVGSVAISNHEACIGRGICAIKAKNKNNQEFLYQWMLWYEPRWASLSQGSTFESVNSSDIKNLQIKLPEPGEQKAISSVLFVADRESELLGSRLNRLKQEKKALMQQLLTGKRRVNVDMEAA